MQYNYSIIIPYRDKYDLFIKAIGSVPDREDIQIIIADNASEPLPQEQIPSKSKATITYTTSSPTKGAGAARNVGLEYVQGKYILFLDADDYFTPDAFNAFDHYLDEDNDIVFFESTSIKLSDGSEANRHIKMRSSIERYLQTGDDSYLRYRWHGPVCKLFRSDFIKKGEYQFEEIRVNNDAWFSLMTGHYAKTIAANKSVVYVITEGSNGSSLTKLKTRENLFLRFKTDIKMNKFLKTVGHYNMRNRLIGAMRLALLSYGPAELFRYILFAFKSKAGIF